MSKSSKSSRSVLLGPEAISGVIITVAVLAAFVSFVARSGLKPCRGNGIKDDNGNCVCNEGYTGTSCQCVPGTAVNKEKATNYETCVSHQ